MRDEFYDMKCYLYKQTQRSDRYKKHLIEDCGNLPGKYMIFNDDDLRGLGRIFKKELEKKDKTISEIRDENEYLKEELRELLNEESPLEKIAFDIKNMQEDGENIVVTKDEIKLMVEDAIKEIVEEIDGILADL